MPSPSKVSTWPSRSTVAPTATPRRSWPPPERRSSWPAAPSSALTTRGRRPVAYARRPMPPSPLEGLVVTGTDGGRRQAKVLTVSDGVIAGTREDKSGAALADALDGAGFDVVERRVVADGTSSVAAA